MTTNVGPPPPATRDFSSGYQGPVRAPRGTKIVAAKSFSAAAESIWEARSELEPIMLPLGGTRSKCSKAAAGSFMAQTRSKARVTS